MIDRSTTQVSRWIWALGGLSLALLASRFVGLGWAPFILDEPALLTEAWKHLLAGTWPSHSHLRNSSGFFYGPTGLWYYRLALQILGPSPLMQIGGMCALITGSLLFFLWKAWPATAAPGARWAALGFALVALVWASSPYQFMLSRLAWDRFDIACCFLAAGILLGRLHGLALWMLGAILGLGLSAHPMVLPFVGAVALTLALERTFGDRRPPWLGLAGGLGLFCAVNLPWLGYLRGLQHLDAAAPALKIQDLGYWLASLGRTATPWGFDYFLDGSASALERELAKGPLRMALGAAMLAVSVLAAWGLWATRNDPRPEVRRLSRICGLAGLATPLMFWFRHLDTHAHYQYAGGVVALWGLLCAARLLSRSSSTRQRTAVYSLFALLAGLNLATIAVSGAWVVSREGTAGVHYGPTLGEQIRVARVLCSSSSNEIVVQNQTSLFPDSLRHHFEHLPECAGKRLHLQAGGRILKPACAGCGRVSVGPP